MVAALSGQSIGVTSGGSPVLTKYRNHLLWQPCLDKAQESLVVAALSGLLSHLLKQNLDHLVCKKLFDCSRVERLHLYVFESSGTRQNVLYRALQKILCLVQRYHIVKTAF